MCRSGPSESDVLVVGSGAAGMAAALAARKQGASVIIIEKTDLIGGSTAVSGGAPWIPCNHHMGELGANDTKGEAREHIARLAEEGSDPELVEQFLDVGPEMVQFVEKVTSIDFKPLRKCANCCPQFKGGKPFGRSLDGGIFNATQLNGWSEKLRRSLIHGPLALSATELSEQNVLVNPMDAPSQLIQERAQAGFVSFGSALIGTMLKELLDDGVQSMTKTSAQRLLSENGRVIGVEVNQGGQLKRIDVQKAVILASGSFEWSKELNAQFLGSKLTHPNTPPGNEGDGLKMAMGLGADIADMSEAWWCPSLVVPGESYEGSPLHRGDFSSRALPHAIIVNQAGRRFVNESHNYNDLVKAMFTFEPGSYTRPNLLAWLIVDSRHLAKYGLLTIMPGMPIPDWLTGADSLEALASKIGVDPDGLTQTVERFNGFVDKGVDPDFHRGESLHDHIYSDHNQPKNPNLGTLEEAPFYALRVYPGALGTKGGVKVNKQSQVMKVDGTPIEGLYAAGNVMASVMGAGYPGAGATIGAAMTFGYIAGKDAASQN